MVKKLYLTSSHKRLRSPNETDLEVVAGAVECHVPGIVVEGQVVLGQGGLATVKGSLVSQGVGTMAN